MMKLKNIGVLVFVMFSLSDNCFGMRGSGAAQGDGGGPNAYSPLLPSGGAVSDGAGAVAVDVAQDAISEYKLPDGITAQEEFRTLLIGVINGPEEYRDENVEVLKALVRAPERNINVRSEFPSIVGRECFVGPIRFIAEQALKAHDAHNQDRVNFLQGITKFLLENNFFWLESDELLGKASIKALGDFGTELRETDDYQHAARCCRPRVQRGLCACASLMGIFSAVGLITAAMARS